MLKSEKSPRRRNEDDKEEPSEDLDLDQLIQDTIEDSGLQLQAKSSQEKSLLIGADGEFLADHINLNSQLITQPNLAAMVANYHRYISLQSEIRKDNRDFLLARINRAVLGPVIASLLAVLFVAFLESGEAELEIILVPFAAVVFLYSFQGAPPLPSRSAINAKLADLKQIEKAYPELMDLAQKIDNELAPNNSRPI